MVDRTKHGYDWPYGLTYEYIDASGLPAIDQPLLRHNNLSDVEDAEQARLNIGAMYGPNNLSEITDPAEARLNLGISGSGTTQTGWDIDVNGDWDDLNSMYPASGHLNEVAFVRQKKKILLGTVTTKQDGLYISDGSTWDKTNLQVQFFDDSLEFLDDIDPSKGMRFELSNLIPSGIVTLGIPAESGTIARIEDIVASSGVNYWTKIGSDLLYNEGIVNIATQTGSWTPSASSNFNVAKGANSAISILAPDAFNSVLYFGDETLATVGSINYNHTNDSMTFNASGNIMTLVDGKAGFNKENPEAPIDINGNIHASGDYVVTQPGKGIVLVSPDGTKTKRLSIDNNGDLEYTNL